MTNCLLAKQKRIVRQSAGILPFSHIDRWINSPDPRLGDDVVDEPRLCLSLYILSGVPSSLPFPVVIDALRAGSALGDRVLEASADLRLFVGVGELCGMEVKEDDGLRGEGVWNEEAERDELERE